MPAPADKRKALVFGVGNLFATEVVDGLIDSGNRIFLCGSDNRHVRRLQDTGCDGIAFFSSWEGPAWLKRTQSMLEWFGSVDTFIYFLDGEIVRNGLQAPARQGAGPAEPIDITRSLVPYLNKVSGCKMVFVNTDAFEPSLNRSGNHVGCFHRMDAMCRSLSEDLEHENIDVRTLFTRPALPPGRTRASAQARHAAPAWNQRLVAWADDSLPFGDILNPA